MSTSMGPTYLHYRLTLRSPAIVSTLSGDPNSAATQPFVPGSAVRGAVAARLLANSITGDSAEFRALILSGAVRYLHAYPEMNGARTLPVPSSWRCSKDRPSDGYDLAAFTGWITDTDEDFGDIWPQASLISVGGTFAVASSTGGVRSLGTPRMDARLHQQRDRVKGRPWKDQNETRHGAIFAYEFLDADQVFRGVVQVMPAASGYINRIKRLLEHPILIGRSRRAGYGGEAKVEFIADGSREYDDVSGLLSKDLSTGERFRVMLTSGYIGRHPITGQIDPLALDHELRERLDRSVTIERRRWAFEVVGGFNQKWRLEVPQVLAVAGGAVLVLQAERQIPLTRLREIEHHGLGERLADGFGRVLFLEPLEDHESFSLIRDHERRTGEGDGHPATSASGVEERQLAFLQKRIVLDAVRTELARVAAGLAHDAKHIPTNSLLGGIRSILRVVQDEQSAAAALANLRAWLDTRKDRVQMQLDGCEVGKDKLPEIPT